MKSTTAGVADYTKNKCTCAKPSLAEMEAVIAWARWGKRIEPHDPVAN